MTRGAPLPGRQRSRATAPTAGRAVAMALALAVVAAPATAPAQDAPYVTDLTRLSELLGALHHLRPLCGAPEKRLWRDKMATLLAAENPTAEVRGRMIARFNRAYRDLSDTYRTCTPAAEALIERYAAEGERITADIVQRYGTTAKTP